MQFAPFVGLVKKLEILLAMSDPWGGGGVLAGKLGGGVRRAS